MDIHELTRTLHTTNESKIVMLVADGLGGLPREPGGPTDRGGSPGGADALEKRRQRKKGKPKEPRIRCPLCKWQPQKSSRWACHCGHAWNTFDTAALCPGCGWQWEETVCLRCHEWSWHRDWYVRTK